MISAARIFVFLVRFEHSAHRRTTTQRQSHKFLNTRSSRSWKKKCIFLHSWIHSLAHRLLKSCSRYSFTCASTHALTHEIDSSMEYGAQGEEWSVQNHLSSTWITFIVCLFPKASAERSMCRPLFRWKHYFIFLERSIHPMPIYARSRSPLRHPKSIEPNDVKKKYRKISLQSNFR